MSNQSTEQLKNPFKKFVEDAKVMGDCPICGWSFALDEGGHKCPKCLECGRIAKSKEVLLPRVYPEEKYIYKSEEGQYLHPNCYQIRVKSFLLEIEERL